MKFYSWDYVDCKMLSHDRMFWVHQQAPDRVRVTLNGAFPKNTPSGPDARPILFEATYDDPALYQLMSVKNRKRSKKIAQMCKEAIAESEKTESP